MSPHIHTGVFAFLFAGVSAVVFIKLSKIAAGKMIESGSMESFGRWLAGVVD